MRHRKKVKKLGRTASHRRALLKNMAGALITNHQIRTTFTKAKALQSFIDRLITFGKKDDVHSRRQVFKLLQNRMLVKKLFDEIATQYGDRAGGYSRVIRLGQRRGDGAEMALIQLVGFEPMKIEEAPEGGKKKKKPKAKKAQPQAEAAPAEASEAAEEAPAAKPKAKAAKKPAKKKAEAAEAKADDAAGKAEAPKAKKTTAKKKTTEKKAAEKKAPEKEADDASEPEGDDTPAKEAPGDESPEKA